MKINSSPAGATGNLQAPNTLLRAMVDASPDFMVVKDNRLVYRAANAAFLRFLGREEADVIGKTDFELFPEEEAERYGDDDRHVLETGETIVRDEFVTGGEGQRWLQVIKTPVSTDDGKFRGVLITVRDISDHKRLEAALTERNERLKTILDNIPVMITFYDAAHKVMYLNRYCEERLGWSSAEANRLDLMAEVYPDPRYRRKVEEYMAHPKIGWRQFTVRTRSDTRLETAWSNVRLSDGSSMGIGIDLTERKEIEQNLREHEQRLQIITETMDDVFWMCTPDLSEVLYVSPGYERMWGFSRDSAYRDPGSFLEAIRPDEREKVRSELLELNRRGEPFTIEGSITSSDGKVKWLRNRGYPVRDPQGRLYAIAGVCTDITELKQSEAAIRELNETLEQRVKARTAELEAATAELESFSYSVAHDLRAPLRAINGFSGILLEDCGPRLEQKDRDYLHRIRDTTVRMGDLIEGLLSLAQTSRAELHPAPIDMSAIAAEVADQLDAAGAERKVTWEIQPGLSAVGDEALVRTLIQNLFDNAWKFTTGCEPARITFGRRSVERGETVFFVADNGVGFSMEFAHKLFRPFERLHNGAHGGDGIGLATVKRIIGKHGGRIWAEATEGTGATFFFTLAPTECAVGSPE